MSAKRKFEKSFLHEFELARVSAESGSEFDIDKVQGYYKEKHNLLFPLKIRTIIDDIMSGRVTRAVIQGCRGSSKTTTGGIIAHQGFKRGWDVSILGGSELQSSLVYDSIRSFIWDDPEVHTVKNIKREIIRDVGRLTESGEKDLSGNWIKTHTASQKSIRGSHVGSSGPQAPHTGIIIIDEECEVDDALIPAFLHSGTTANPLIILRMSTWHRIFGSFGQAIKNARDWGYTVYQIDCFDICEMCRDKCSACIPEFRDDFCQGKAKGSRGWLKIAEIKSMWTQRISDEIFHVEMLGRGKGTKDLVLNPNHLERSIRKAPFLEGQGITVGGLDQGFIECALIGLQSVDGRVRVFDSLFFQRVSLDEKVNKTKEFYKKYGLKKIASDSSAQGKELTGHFRRAGKMNMVDVFFSTKKQIAVESLIFLLTHDLIDIDPRNKRLIDQLKEWKFKKDSEVIAKSGYPEHGCDALSIACLVLDPLKGAPGQSVDPPRFLVGKKKRETRLVFESDGVDELGPNPWGKGSLFE